jgi:hypothetical protein
MITSFFNAIESINISILLTGIFIFFIGYGSAPYFYHRNLKFILAYPLWITKKIELWSQKSWNPIFLFTVIVLLNSASLIIVLVSSSILILPVIFILWTGLNMGIMTFHSLKGKFYFASLFNPISILELPAAFITFAIALQMNLSQLQFTTFQLTVFSFDELFAIFTETIMPILILAGIVETVFIHYAQKMGSLDDFDDV